MALAVTLLGSATFDTNAGTKTVTATPAVGDLIVIVTGHSGNTATTPPTDDKGGTYSLVTSTFKNVSADGLAVFVRNQLISSATSTIFTHAPGTTTGGGLAVFKVTGTPGGLAAVRQSAREINKSSGAAPAPVFPSTPSSGNAIVGAVLMGHFGATLSPRSGYTERVDASYITPSANLEIMSRNSGETSATITWGTAAVADNCSIVVELTSSQPLTPPLFQNTNSFYAPSVKFAPFRPAKLSNSNSFYAPTISVDGAMSATLFQNSNSFYGPSIKFAPLTPSIFSNDNTFYGVSVGLISELAAEFFLNDNTFFPPTISGWFTQPGGGETWTPIYPDNVWLDENGDPITDENGDYILDGTEEWTGVTNDTNIWTRAG